MVNFRVCKSKTSNLYNFQVLKLHNLDTDKLLKRNLHSIACTNYLTFDILWVIFFYIYIYKLHK